MAKSLAIIRIYKPWFFLLALFTSCNTFSGIDNPSSDAQYNAAAEAHMDRQEYAQALALYLKISPNSIDYQEERALHSAFALLASLGMPSSGLITMLFNSGSSGVGKLITSLGNSWIPTASEETRLTLFEAYLEHKKLSNISVKSIMRFILGLYLTAELLAENSASKSQILQKDLVQSPSECKSAMASCNNDLSLCIFQVANVCKAPSGSLFVKGQTISSLTDATSSQMEGSPSLYMILASIQEIQDGLLDLQSGSSFASDSANLASQLLLFGATAIELYSQIGSPAFRGLLIQNDIGS